MDSLLSSCVALEFYGYLYEERIIYIDTKQGRKTGVRRHLTIGDDQQMVHCPAAMF